MIYVVAVVSIIGALVGYLVWLEIRGQRMWVLSQHQYKGFPLFLRRIERLPFPSRRAKQPVLATITHTFTKRRPDGLPESAYNDTLFEMDQKLIEAMNGIGSPVLIETFGGKRNFYYYVTDAGLAEARFSSIRQGFAQEELVIDCRPDPAWNFIYNYFKNFFPDQLWAFDPLPSRNNE